MFLVNLLALPMKINGERLLTDLYQLKEYTDTPGQGVTRFSYGDNDKKARDYLFKQASELGCGIEIDAVKNVRISLPQNRQGRKKIVVGSHVDTVRNGGWLDGIYGVASGLEVLRILKDQSLDKNLELVIFAEEEGSNFGSTMTGSKFIVGAYRESSLDKLKNDRGISLRSILGNPSAEQINAVRWDFSKIDTMLELHIEQGPVLEREGLSIGIVDAIFGMQVIEVELQGTGNHAGATPMIDRKDALCAAAECILAAESLVRPDGQTVVTVGKICVEPDCSNVIPERAVFTLEVRDKDDEKICRYMQSIMEKIREISVARDVKCQITTTSQSKPLKLDSKLIKKMKELAIKKEIPHKIMNSGAVHDACMIAAHAPTAMIFVPSIDGRSHVPEENTPIEDLIQGAQFLLDFVLNLTN